MRNQTSYSLIIAMAMSIAMLMSIGSVNAAVGVGAWTSNNNIQLTITNGQAAQFDFGITAVSSLGGQYSIYFYRNGESNPLKTYVLNKPTVNDGATGYISVNPSDYQNTPGDYYVLIYSVDDYGADTFQMSLHVNPASAPLAIQCSANPTSGTVPLNVDFTSTATGGSGSYVKYAWSYADNSGQVTLTSGSSHLYNNAGTYNPTVTVTDSNGNTAVASCSANGIQVSNKPLSASCSLNPSSGTEPLFVTLAGNANGGTGTYSYHWVFADGSSTSTQSSSTGHSYNAGYYNPQLTVSDGINSVVVDCGALSVNKQQITLSITAYGVPSTGYAQLQVLFTANPAGGSGSYVSYQWDFNDGSTISSTSKTIYHTFQNTGIYYPNVKVTDTQSNTASALTNPITVIKKPVMLSVMCSNYPTSGTAPLNVALSASASGGTGIYTNYYWNFHDSQFSGSNGPSIAHTYTNAGNYSPDVTVTDSEGNTAQATCTPTVKVSAKITPLTLKCVEDPTSGTVPLKVYFTAVPSGGSGVYVKYIYMTQDQDPVTYYISTFDHTYVMAGNYTPYIIAFDSLGNQARADCAQIKVSNNQVPLALSATANPTSGYVPLNVSFGATATGGTGTYTRYVWNFGDGSTSSAATAASTHVYTYTGIYYPGVTVTDSNGNTASATTHPINVTTKPVKLAASCDANPKSGTIPLNVMFTSTASGGSGTYRYIWNYGDGATQNNTVSNPSHAYNNAGTYYPTLTVTDTSGNSATATCPTIKANKPVVQNLTASCDANPKSGTIPLNVMFTSTASGGTGTLAYHWIFGDNNAVNTTSGSTNHAYTTAGKYYPTLYVTDSAGNSATASCGTITANSPCSSLSVICTANPKNGTAPLDVALNSAASGGSGNYYYSWIFGDGQVRDTTSSSTNHTYQNAGTYYPILTVSDGTNTASTICAISGITVNPQVLGITGTCNADPASGPTPLNVHYFASLSGGNGNYYYLWDFNDGSSGTSSNSNTQHVFNSDGNYTARLFVSDSAGHSAIIPCTKVNVQTTAALSLSCDAMPTNGTAPLNVILNANATGGNGSYTYAWNFQDGQTQNTAIASVAHIFMNSGIFMPNVQVYDASGHSANAYCPRITVQQPQYPISASCMANPTFGTSPLQVAFLAQASGGLGSFTYRWTYNDSYSDSTSNNYVSHTYQSTGTFNPTLQVTDSHGDTVTVPCSIVTVNPNVPTDLIANCSAVPTSGMVPLQVSFVSQSTGGKVPYSYYWNFGDMQTSGSSNNYISHTYSNTGTFNPTLIVYDSNGKSATTTCPQINVTSTSSQLSLTCTAQPTSGNSPLLVNYNAAATGGSGTYTQYTWNVISQTYFTPTGNFQYVFPSGIFSTLVTVIDNAGNTATATCPTIISMGNNVTNSTLTADAGGPYSGFTNEALTFDASKSTGNIVNYVWDFGDGTEMGTTTNTISHTYTNKVGIFKISLIVYDAQGNSAHAFTTARIVERTNYKAAVASTDSGLTVQSILMYGDSGYDTVKRNDDVHIMVHAVNDHRESIDNAHVRVEIPDLNIQQDSKSVDLGQSDQEMFHLDIPLNNVPAGTYDVKIITGNEQVNRVKYRQLIVR